MTSTQVAFARNRSEILAYFRRRLRNPDEAEDLCQETFARAWPQREQLRQPENLRAYLYRTARNLLINHLKRRNVVTSASDVDAHFDIGQVADPRLQDPEQTAGFVELEDKLRALLRALPAEHKLAFELGVIQRMVYAEIASQTGWSLSKVKINVYRARKRIIEELRTDEQRQPSRADRKEGS